MEEVIIKIFTGGGGIVSVLTVLFFTLSVAEEGIKDEIKKNTGIKIEAFSLGSFIHSFSNYAQVLLKVFFTDRYFSSRWILRSFVASALFCLLLHCLYFFRNTHLLINRPWLPFFTNFITYFLLYTCFDFLVLWKTQVVLKRLNKTRSWGLIITLLIDISSTFLFGFIKYLVIILVSGFHTSDIVHFFNNVVTVNVPDEFIQHGYGVIPGLFFYTTFLYTLFFIIYFVSVCLWAIAKSFDWVKGKFDVVNRPFKFIQFITGFILLMIVIILFIVEKN